MKHKTPRDFYREQRSQAKVRNIPWLLSYEQWLEIWLLSGKWSERGCHRGQYCMARYGDVGAYERSNVSVITHAENLRQSNAVRNYQPHSEETKKQISESMIGQTRQTVSNANRNRIWTEESRNKISEAQSRAWKKRKGI